MKKLLYRLEYFYKINIKNDISFPSTGMVYYVYRKRESNKLTYTYDYMAHTYAFSMNEEDGISDCMRFYSDKNSGLKVTRERVRQLLWKFIRVNKRYLK